MNFHYTETDKRIAAETAKILLEINAINFNIDNPYTLTSKWVSPIYVDCRKIIYHPNARKQICKMMIEKIHNHIGYETIETIAGGETAGIPFAAWVADGLHLPMSYVRKTQKTFGKGSLIEGDVPVGKNTLLVEDLTTDGASKIHFANALRDAGAIVNHAMVVFYYGAFSNCKDELANMKLDLHYLCNWFDVIEFCKATKYYNLFSTETFNEVQNFLCKPIEWSAAHGGRAA